MPLDPYLAARLDSIRDLTFTGMPDDATLEKLRVWSADPGPWTVPDGVAIAERLVDGPHGGIPVRVYRREADAEPGGVLVWVHGGGFQAGELDWPEAHVVSAELAARTGFLVASVDYRLAVGGVRYPIPLDDVVSVLEWAGAALAGDGRLAIGGASAGAALALAATMRVRDAGGRMPDQVLLAYPFAHFPNPVLDDAVATEMTALPPMLRFPAASIEGMVANYVGRISDIPPLALPGAAPLGGLPPVHVMVSEFDDLRASGDLLERQLAEAGIPVTSYVARGMPHGHLNRLPSLPEVDRSLDDFARVLRAAVPRSR